MVGKQPLETNVLCTLADFWCHKNIDMTPFLPIPKDLLIQTGIFVPLNKRRAQETPQTNALTWS